MIRRAGILAAVALVVLLSGSRVLASCRPGEGVEQVASTDRWGLETPDASRVIWSGDSGFTLTEVVQLPPQPVIKTPDGGHIGAGGTAARRYQYCPIDWSPDSRYLLAREVAAVVRADQYDRTAYRILERGGLPGRPVSLLRLWEAVEDHWLKKGRDVSLGGGYYLEAVGWESAATRRIVHAAWRRVTPAVDADRLDRFLGYWSVETTGLDPRLLAETIDGFRVPRFGRVLAPPAPPAGR